MGCPFTKDALGVPLKQPTSSCSQCAPPTLLTRRTPHHPQLLKMFRTLPALFLLHALSAATAQRTTVDVSFGWRFRLGENAAPCNASSFPHDLAGQQVMGLNAAPAATDAASCLAAACTASVSVWQWCPGGGAQCGSASCWIGDWPGTSQSQGGWVGGYSSASSGPPVNPPEAQPSFNDGGWEVVDLPHDFQLDMGFSPNANGGEGFMPYNVSYYRKHFVLPASWASSRVELYVEGAISASTWWLNGVPLAGGKMFYSSYTAIPLRLDNVPGVVFGGPNVLTAYVNGRLRTGWWYEGSGIPRRSLLFGGGSLSGSISTHGIWAPANVTGPATPHTPGLPSAGISAPAIVSPQVLLRNDGTTTSSLIALRCGGG